VHYSNLHFTRNAPLPPFWKIRKVEATRDAADELAAALADHSPSAAAPTASPFACLFRIAAHTTGRPPCPHPAPIPHTAIRVVEVALIFIEASPASDALVTTFPPSVAANAWLASLISPHFSFSAFNVALTALTVAWLDALFAKAVTASLFDCLADQPAPTLRLVPPRACSSPSHHPLPPILRSVRSSHTTPTATSRRGTRSCS
jgi:hypothetical protein